MATAKKPAKKVAAKKLELTPANKKINEIKSRMAFVKSASTPAKKAPAKKIAKKVEEQFAMPMEVKEWIDQAMSRMRSLQAKVDRLEVENKELKSYKRWAEHRILGSSPE